MEQFMLLATKGQPLWLPTPDQGEALSYLGSCYRKKAHPVHHDGFVMEASRATGMVRAASADSLVAILTEAVRALDTYTYSYLMCAMYSQC